jgi:hypothetical protein
MFKVLIVSFLLFPLFTFSQIAFVELDSKKIPEPAVRDTVIENWNRSQPGYENLPKESKEMLYWTNYARKNPDKFWKEAIVPIIDAFPPLNKAEAKSLQADLTKVGALPMFTLSQVLIATSQSHADDIGKKKAPLSHTSTNGADFGSRMKKANIRYCANENISLSSQSILLSTVLLYLDIGVAGMGHRKTLLDPSLREIGIGSSLYGKDQYFLVQDFSCKQ